MTSLICDLELVWCIRVFLFGGGAIESVKARPTQAQINFYTEKKELSFGHQTSPLRTQPNSTRPHLDFQPQFFTCSHLYLYIIIIQLRQKKDNFYPEAAEDNYPSWVIEKKNQFDNHTKKITMCLASRVNTNIVGPRVAPPPPGGGGC